MPRYFSMQLLLGLVFFFLVKSIKIAPSGAVTKIAITLAARTS